MHIILVKEHKKHFLDLLLLADEEEAMIDRYLDRGDLFVLFDGQADDECVSHARSACVVTQESDDTFEIKNLATDPVYQKQGYAKHLLDYVFMLYTSKGKTMLVGTGDSPTTLGFYERYGFQPSHRVANFFTEHYTHPIIEDGVQLVDMVYLKKSL